MPSLPYMQFYPAEYLADTSHLSAEEHGAYFLLIMNYWQRGKPFKNSDERLANVARMSSERWAAIKQTISEFFEVTDEEWIHRRIERDLATVRDRSAKASAAGKASAEIRRSTPVEQALNERSTDVQLEANHKEKIREEKTGQEPKATPPQAVTLPAWVPSDSWKGFVEMRKKIRAPLTPRAIEATIRELDKLRSSGQDPGSVLDQSTQRGWRGVFELKGVTGNGRETHNERVLRETLEKLGDD